MIAWWVYVAVLAGLAVFTLLLGVIVKTVASADTSGKPRGIATLVVGDDGRASTSKLQAMLWTFAVLWALISLLAGAGIDTFHTALSSNLREEYLLLLGGPFAAAIASKAITTNRTADDPSVKPVKQPTGKVTLTERVAEIVSNDHGAVDLGDFQYFAFTLVTLAYFAWAFIAKPAAGLPEVPGTLLVLVGVSQATYVAKKALPAGKSGGAGNGGPGNGGPPAPESGEPAAG